MIELTQFEKPILQFIQESISLFSHHYPTTAVSNIGLYSSPVNGWVSIAFDTEAHSNENVAEFKDQGPDWYGKDANGEYCDNCPDFEFTDFNAIFFDKWIEEYEDGKRLIIKISTTKTKEFDAEQDYEALNKVFFNFLTYIIKEAEKQSLFTVVNRESVFRIGVQMLDSEYLEFWVSE